MSNSASFWQKKNPRIFSRIPVVQMYCVMTLNSVLRTLALSSKAHEEEEASKTTTTTTFFCANQARECHGSKTDKKEASVN